MDRWEAAQAALALADTYAAPSGACRRCAAPVAEGPPSLADMSERLAELAAKAAELPAWAAYAEPSGAAWRRAAPAADQLPSLADLSERLAELCAAKGAGQGGSACAAAAAVPDCWAYAEPCGSAPLGRAAPVVSQLPSLADMAARLAELCAKDGAARALDALADSLAYAEPGLPVRAKVRRRPAAVAELWDAHGRLRGCRGGPPPARRHQLRARACSSAAAACLPMRPHAATDPPTRQPNAGLQPRPAGAGRHARAPG